MNREALKKEFWSSGPFSLAIKNIKVLKCFETMIGNLKNKRGK